MKPLEILNAVLVMDSDTVEYRLLLATMLERLDPTKPLGTQLYQAVARHSWNVYCESVAFRHNRTTGELEVFLIKRGADDSDWQGYWHAPGTALRPGDASEDPRARLAREYGVPISSLECVGSTGFGWNTSDARSRGPGISYVFLTSLVGKPRLGDNRGWFPVNNLPYPTVPAHVDEIIPHALAAFRCVI